MAAVVAAVSRAHPIQGHIRVWRIVLCSLAGAAIIFKGILMWTHPLLRGGVGQDIINLYVGALALREGLNPYTAGVALGQHLTGIPPRLHPFPYVHPPAVALMLTPLTWLDLPSAYRLLTVIDLVAPPLAALCVLLALRAPRSVVLWTELIVVASGSGLLAIWHGQLTPLLALAAAGSFLLVARGRYAWGGVVSTLLLVKPQLYALALIVTFLLGNRQWRRGVTIGVVLFAALCLVAVGPGGCIAFVQATLRDAGGHERLHDVDSLALDGLYYYVWPKHVANLLLVATVAMALVLGLPLLRVVRATRQARYLRLNALAALLLLDSLLFPYSHQYDCSLLLLPYIVAVVTMPAGRVRVAVLSLSALSAIMPYLGIFRLPPGPRPLSLVDLAMVLLLSAYCLLPPRRRSDSTTRGSFVALEAWRVALNTAGPNGMDRAALAVDPRA